MLTMGRPLCRCRRGVLKLLVAFSFGVCVTIIIDGVGAPVNPIDEDLGGMDAEPPGYDVGVSDESFRPRVLHQRNASPVNGSLLYVYDSPGPTSTMAGRLQRLANSSSVVNSHPFTYRHTPSAVCGPNIPDGLFVLVYVHTAPEHFSRREAIRQTWGNSSLLAPTGVTLKVVFVLGVSPLVPVLEGAVDAEVARHGDILQEDFEDTYRNLTLKAISALRWVATRCGHHAHYVIKTDDDVFVDVFALGRLLAGLYARGQRADLLMCKVWFGMRVMREGKWAVETEQFAQPTYPSYCSGLAFVMTPDVAAALYHASFYVPFFWVDDVYVTGLIPMSLGLFPAQGRRYYVDKSELVRILTTGVYRTEGAIFAHVAMEEVPYLWQRLLYLETYAPSAPVRVRNHGLVTTPTLGSDQLHPMQVKKLPDRRLTTPTVLDLLKSRNALAGRS